MRSHRLLVADTPDAVTELRRALHGGFELTTVATLEAARAALAEVPPLVICGCHFDEGRMYDLLRHLKAADTLAGVRFMAVRCLEGELEDAIYESVKIAVRALGGNAFVDLPRWRRKYGDAAASERLTRIVEQLVRPVEGDSE